MATLSREQIEDLLVKAGFKKNSQTLSTMVAIAYAESGGNPTAHNGNAKTGDDSYGLWQINMLGSLGPARRKQFGITSNAQLYDPATNAKAAYMIYKSSGLDAWSTYKTGKYLSYMDKTTTEEGGNKNPVDTIAGKVSDMTGVTGAIDKVGNDLFKGLSNVMGVIVAIALLVLGAVFLLRNVVPAGKVVKAVKNVAGETK